MRRRDVAELAVEIARVIVLTHDNGPLGGDQAPDAIEGLLQERRWAEKGYVLLGAVLAEQTLQERSEPAAVSTGEDDGPRSR
jgi:hypothetical protein